MTTRNPETGAAPARTSLAPAALIVTLFGTMAAAANWPQEDEALSRVLRSGPGVVNHPVGVRPSRAARIPEGWPLDAGGRITCTTCHESIPALSGRGGAKLRRGAGGTGDPAAFCATCHGPSERGAGSMHWRALRRAHVRPTSRAQAPGYGSLDADSVRCLSCHDGVTARETGYQTTSGHGAMSFTGTARNHPVGVRYRAFGRERGDKLRAAQALPPAVRLPGGRVSCISCHDLYSRGRSS